MIMMYKDERSIYMMAYCGVYREKEKIKIVRDRPHTIIGLMMMMIHQPQDQKNIRYSASRSFK